MSTERIAVPIEATDVECLLVGRALREFDSRMGPIVRAAIHSLVRDAILAAHSTAAAELEALRRAAYVLAMRVLQSDLVLDDEEIAARDLFIAQEKAK